MVAALTVGVAAAPAIGDPAEVGGIEQWGAASASYPISQGPWKAVAAHSNDGIVAIKEDGTLQTLAGASLGLPAGVVGQQALSVDVYASSAAGAVLDDGSVHFWGQQRGLTAGNPVLTPAQLNPGSDPVNAKQVSVSPSLFMVLLADGRVGKKTSLGYEIVGDLGGEQLTGATQIVAAVGEGYILKDDGSVALVSSADPVTVVEADAEHPVVNISAGIGVRDDGSVVQFSGAENSGVNNEFVPELPGTVVQAAKSFNEFCAARTDLGYVGVWSCAEGPLLPDGSQDFVKPPPALQGRILSLDSNATSLSQNFIALVSDTVPPLVEDAQPTIAGAAQVGGVLTGTEGSFYGLPDAVSSQWYAGDAPIVGATGTSYTLTAAEIGKVITYRSTATKAGLADAVSSSEPTATVVEVTFEVVNETLPSITGTAAVDATLTAVDGTWDPADATLTRRWLRDGVPIANATGQTYLLKPADYETKISVEVTGRKSGYTLATAESAETDTVTDVDVVAITRPELAGAMKVGEAPPYVNWGFTGNPTKITVETLMDGVVVHEGLIDGQRYQLAMADIGKMISIRLTATRRNEAPVVATSLEYGPVEPRNAIPIVATPSSVAGTARAGQVLTGTPATFSGFPVPTVVNVWLANGNPIAGATSTTYALKTSDVGKSITFRSTGSNSIGSVSSVSNVVGPIADLTAPGVAVVAPQGTYGKASAVAVTVSGGAAGSVTLRMDGVPVGTVAISGGSATFAIPATTRAGSHALAATYAGSATHKAASGAGTLTVAKRAASKPTFKASKSPTSKKAGKATVTVTAPAGLAKATGKVTVSFKKGGSTKKVTGTLKAGKVTIKVPKLKKGSYKVTVSYNGDANYNKGTSKTYSMKVKK